MYKVDKLKCFLDCEHCNKLLADPVVMTCGKFICKIHLEKLLTHESKEKKSFICVICQEEHVIPKNGFVVNDRLQELLDVELNKLAPSPMFEECMKEIENAKENVVKIGLLEKNAENYIYEYFEDIKRQVDIRREDLKLKIDNYSDEIIKSVEMNQMNLIKLSKEVNQITTNIEKSRKDLNELIARFDTLEFNDEKFKDIKESVTVVNQEFHKILVEYQDNLIGNKKCTFEFIESQVEDIFGRVFDFQLGCDFDSTILNKQNKKSILLLCTFPSAKQWKLQYRATKDGFSAENFHSKCDGIANTLTIIKSTTGNIFGGFTEKAWDSSGKYYRDPKAFIFSLVNKENKPVKVMCTNGADAIYCQSYFGPIFGNSKGHDIGINKNSNVSENWSYCGSSYKHADYPTDTEKAKALAGSHHFQTLDIEVFIQTN